LRMNLKRDLHAVVHKFDGQRSERFRLKSIRRSMYQRMRGSVYAEKVEITASHTCWEMQLPPAAPEEAVVSPEAAAAAVRVDVEQK